MPASEIDEIFASKSGREIIGSTAISSKAKGKAKALDTSSGNTEAVGKKSKKKKKRKDDLADSKLSINAQSPEEDGITPIASNAKRKRAEPETVVDPSLPVKKVKTAAESRKSSHTGKTSSKNTEEEKRFRDSRGTGPRRTTEEGFSIYKEDELGIKDGGGDTPLCPFDCDCCF